MSTKTRRTPEQLAIYYQSKANKARADAAKAARRKEDRIRSIIAAGMMDRADGKNGGFRVGEYEGRLALYSFVNHGLSDEDRELLFEWASQTK